MGTTTARRKERPLDLPVLLVCLFLRHDTVYLNRIPIDKIEQDVLGPDMHPPPVLPSTKSFDITRGIRVAR